MGHPLIAFNQQSPAHLLANYLTSQHIQANVVQHDKEFVVVLDNSEHIDRAKIIAEDFLANPTHPKYQQAAWDNGKNVQLACSKSTIYLGGIYSLRCRLFVVVVWVVCAHSETFIDAALFCFVRESRMVASTWSRIYSLFSASHHI